MDINFEVRKCLQFAKIDPMLVEFLVVYLREQDPITGGSVINTHILSDGTLINSTPENKISVVYQDGQIITIPTSISDVVFAIEVF